MTNVHDIDPREARYDEASLWIARLDRGLSADEARELQNWMAADAQNAATLESMARMWDKMDSLARLSELFPNPPHQKQNRQRHSRRFSLPVIAFAHRGALAASFLVAVFVGGWAMLQSGLWAGDATFEQVYETAVGEQSNITLRDGTQVRLNTNSKLRVEYTDDYRLLTMDRGELNVQVAKDSKRRLSVVANGQVVQAIGTEFNVKITEDHQIELLVTEGRVKIGVVERPMVNPASRKIAPEDLPASALMVSAGERVMVTEPEPKVEKISPEEIAVKLSWRSGNLTFRGESLEEALREVSRYTQVEFVIVDDELRSHRVSGLFKTGDVDTLLLALENNFDIVYEKVDHQKVLLSSR